MCLVPRCKMSLRYSYWEAKVFGVLLIKLLIQLTTRPFFCNVNFKHAILKFLKGERKEFGREKDETEVEN